MKPATAVPNLPFWPENLTSPAAWNVETRKCPGMNTGTHYTQQRIETLRDAPDWPDRPPGSGQLPIKPKK